LVTSFGVGLMRMGTDSAPRSPFDSLITITPSRPVLAAQISRSVHLRQLAPLK
jgi:hypothetical protein